MPGKTPAPTEAPYALKTDKPADIEAATKPGAERLAAILESSDYQPLSWLEKGTKKQIIVCNSSGVPQYVTLGGDATLAEDGTLTIADTLKPSKGAAAGTESLRALGTSASTACAGNDSRLTNERTPTAGSVTRAKVAAGALKTAREAIPSTAAGAASIVTITWAAPFANTNYTVELATEAEVVNSESLTPLTITEKTAEKIKVAVRNGAGVGKALTGVLHVTAWAD